MDAAMKRAWLQTTLLRDGIYLEAALDQAGEVSDEGTAQSLQTLDGLPFLSKFYRSNDPCGNAANL